MVKKKFYAVKYVDGPGVIIDDYDDYLKARKGYSGCSNRVFKKLADAKDWLDGNYTLLLGDSKYERQTLYFAVANDRYIGITTSEKKYLKLMENHPQSKGKAGFKSEAEALAWLTKQGISKVNKKGIYAVVRGWRTGVFNYLHTYEKNIHAYPNALGKGGFQSKAEAQEWVRINRKTSVKPKEYFGIAFGRRSGVFTKEETYLKNIEGQRLYWARRGFQTKEETRKWVDIRRDFIMNEKNQSLVEANISCEMGQMPIVYIDGSYYPKENKYGASVVIYKSDGELSTFSHSKECDASNTLAEIEALSYCVKLMAHVYEIKEFILVYDYENLNRIALGEIQIKSISKKLQENIVQEIAKHQLTIHFLKIKSHSGYNGNSIADKLARDAIERLGSYPSLFEDHQ